MFSCFVFPALTGAAERFRELQAEKEMKQLQEDRKNDKKPPPYRHIKVLCVTTLCFSSLTKEQFTEVNGKIKSCPCLCFLGQPANWEGADHYCRPIRDPTL